MGVMWEMKEGGTQPFDALDRSEITIAILEMECWAQTARHEEDKIREKPRDLYMDRNERPNVVVVSLKSRNGAPYRKGCVSMVRGQRQAIYEYALPPTPPPPTHPASPHLRRNLQAVRHELHERIAQRHSIPQPRRQ